MLRDGHTGAQVTWVMWESPEAFSSVSLISSPCLWIWGEHGGDRLLCAGSPHHLHVGRSQCQLCLSLCFWDIWQLQVLPLAMWAASKPSSADSCVVPKDGTLCWRWHDGHGMVCTALVGVRQNSEWMRNWRFYLKVEQVHSENVVLKWGGMDASQLGYRAALCLNKLSLLLCAGVALQLCLCSYRLYRDQGMPFLINNHSSLMY